ANPLYKQQFSPASRRYERPDNPLNPVGSEVFPYVFTTSRLTEHHTAGGMSRTLPYLSELQPEMFIEVSPELAAERGLTALGWARAAVPCSTTSQGTAGGPVFPMVRRETATTVERAADPAAASGYLDPPPRMGFFTDTSICIGCKACEVACKEWNGVPDDGFNLLGMSYDNTGGLSANSWRAVAFVEQPAAARPAGPAT